MGSGISHLIPCIRPEDAGGAAVAVENRNNHQHEVWFEAEEQLDGTLGHSFCYIPSSARFLSPTPSDRFLSPTQSFRVSPSHDRSDPKARCAGPETGFRAISGASVSANTSTPKTFFQLDGVYDDSNDFSAAGVGWLREYGSIVNGFESTSSFSALPLQPVPRGERTGTTEGGGLFLSGPIERGALSGPLDLSAMDGADNGSLPFSAPLGRGGSYAKNNNKKRRNKSFSGIKKAFQRSLSEKKRPWVVPVRNFAGRKELAGGGARDVGETQTGGGRIGAAAAAASMVKNVNDTNVQWALGKAGEDRVHVVISEEHGWLFVGIYDGFNGPDAPEFLMSHLYRAVFHELKGLFWDSEENCSGSNCNLTTGGHHGIVNIDSVNGTFRVGEVDAFDGKGISSSSDNEICVESIKENQVIPGENDRVSVKRVTFQSEKKDPKRKLWEFLAEDDAEDGLDLSGSERFAFSVDEAVSVSNAGSAVDKRTLLLSKLKQGISRKKNECGMSLFPWRLGSEVEDKIETENKVGERTSRNCMRKISAVNHGMVLRALSQALEKTELAYLDLSDKVIDQYPELAVMGSCLLAVLMRENDVYVMNLGDSRAIVAQLEPNAKHEGENDIGSSSVGLVEDPAVSNGKSIGPVLSNPKQPEGLIAGSLDLITMLLKNAPLDVVKALFDVCFNCVIRIVLQSDDNTEMQNATECLTAFVSAARLELLAWGDPGFVMKSLLDALSRLLNPTMESSGSFFVGSFILQLILHLPSQMMQHIPDLVGALVRRMQSCEIAGLKNSLVLVFSRLVHASSPNIHQFIELLLSVPADDYDNSFVYVMSEWVKLQGEVQGAYQIKVTTTALALLLSTRHVVLEKINVQGHPIKSNTGIVTRSRAKLGSEQWTVMPLHAKILGLLSDALIEIQEQVLGEEDEDSDWEEVETSNLDRDHDAPCTTSSKYTEKPTSAHLYDLAKAFDNSQEDGDEDDLLSSSDPLNEINLAKYLVDFLLNFRQSDASYFSHIYQFLTHPQQKAIENILCR